MGFFFSTLGLGGEMDRVRIFYSYSHDEEKYCRRLDTHLSVLRRQGLIDGWHYRRILAGQNWNDEIDQHFEQSQIILLLISASFIASDYCYGRELKRALELHDDGRATVIPVIVRPVDWMNLPFSKLQALPTDGKPVTKWHDQEEAWADITQGIREVIANIQRQVVV